MKTIVCVSLALAAPLCGQVDGKSGDQVVGAVQILVPAAEELFASNAKVETLATTLQFCEGPVWVPAMAALVFSDIPRNQWLRWTAAEGVGVWKASAGANGNLLDREGRLLSCQHGDRNVVRHEQDGKLTVLAATHAGKPLNSPNDLAVRFDGTIWFSDPTYGLGKRPKEQAGNFVYRLDPATDNLVAVLTEGFDQPNGLCFAPDHQRLYVADSGKGQRVGAFPVAADGSLGTPVFWLDGGSDGMRCDAQGNLYTTARDGVRVYSPAGELLAKVVLAQAPTNCAFGGPTGTDLFVTARQHLYRIPMRVQGAPWPAPPVPAVAPAGPAPAKRQ